MPLLCCGPRSAPSRKHPLNLSDYLYDLKPLWAAVLMPPAPLLLLMLIGAGQLRQRRWLGRLLLTLGAVGAWLACTEGAGLWLARRLIDPPPVLGPAEIDALAREQKAAGKIAVFVLGGGARSFVGEYDGPRLNTFSRERLQFGVWLARRIGAPLGFSGGVGTHAIQQQEPEATLAALSAEQDYGFKLRWVESRSRDTRGNARETIALLRAAGITKLLLVTHDLHEPRALKSFRVESYAQTRGEIEVVAAPITWRQEPMTRWLDWAPSSEGFTRVRYATYEWLGQLAGR